MNYTINFKKYNVVFIKLSMYFLIDIQTKKSIINYKSKYIKFRHGEVSYQHSIRILR